MTKEEMIDKALELCRAGNWEGLTAFLLENQKSPYWGALCRVVTDYKRKQEPVRHEDLSI